MRRQEFLARHLVRSPNGLFQPKINVRKIPVVHKRSPAPPLPPSQSPVQATPIVQPIQSLETPQQIISQQTTTTTTTTTTSTSPQDKKQSIETHEQHLANLRKSCMIPEIEAYFQDKTRTCYVGLEFPCSFNEINVDFVAPCLWCKYYFTIPKEQLNCRIFRHGKHKKKNQPTTTTTVTKDGDSKTTIKNTFEEGELINPHASEQTVAELLKHDAIFGCGMPMFYDGVVARAVGFNT